MLPHEIVVVDDCSTDDTVNCVRELSRQSPVELRIISREVNSGGPSAPINDGVRISQGNLIAVLDQDDEFDERKIEIQSRFFFGAPQRSACRRCRRPSQTPAFRLTIPFLRRRFRRAVKRLAAGLWSL